MTSGAGAFWCSATRASIVEFFGRYLEVTVTFEEQGG
jgi:hypothetical protein